MKICPEGWHLPSVAEWSTLVATVGDSLSAGGMLKSADSWMKLTDSTASQSLDVYEFSALPAGFRKEDYNDGLYYDLGKFANFWTSSSKDDSYAFHITMRYDGEKVQVISDPTSYGLSVRCVKN